jgi:DNA-binding NtrC family response regulator
MNGNILVVDDEEQLCRLLFRLLSLEGFTVREAANLKAATQMLQQQPSDVVLCDVKLPDGNGVDFVSSVKKKFPSTEVILLTAFGNIADGVQAMKNGAFDYLEKGNENNRIIPLLYQAVERSRRHAQSAIKIAGKSSGNFDAIVGAGSLIRRAIEQARKIAVTDAAVLLLGETGTGKEVFANAIHNNSKRSKFPIVAINCSAISRDLLEGELFGHKAGAYTGAIKDKQGLVEVADGGTLFLDEIGEMPLELQAKLLRFLETGEFIKIGDVKTSKVNVRIIAATNRNLNQEIASGHFREDLYYRLNVFSIELPALRERPEDVPALVDFFLHQFGRELDKPHITITKDAMELLRQYQWKGNVRELKNIIQRAIILADNDEIRPINFPYVIQSAHLRANEYSLAAVEEMHIRKMLDHTNGNRTKAAQLLGIGVATLYRKIDEYKIGDATSK